MAYAFLFIIETESAGLGNNEYYRVSIDERYHIGVDKYSSMQRLFFGHR